MMCGNPNDDLEEEEDDDNPPQPNTSKAALVDNESSDNETLANLVHAGCDRLLAEEAIYTQKLSPDKAFEFCHNEGLRAQVRGDAASAARLSTGRENLRSGDEAAVTAASTLAAAAGAGKEAKREGKKRARPAAEEAQKVVKKEANKKEGKKEGKKRASQPQAPKYSPPKAGQPQYSGCSADLQMFAQRALDAEPLVTLALLALVGGVETLRRAHEEQTNLLKSLIAPRQPLAVPPSPAVPAPPVVPAPGSSSIQSPSESAVLDSDDQGDPPDDSASVDEQQESQAS
jgi:hypothetical protein